MVAFFSPKKAPWLTPACQASTVIDLQVLMMAFPCPFKPRDDSGFPLGVFVNLYSFLYFAHTFVSGPSLDWRLFTLLSVPSVCCWGSDLYVIQRHLYCIVTKCAMLKKMMVVNP